MSSILLEEPIATKRSTYADYKALDVDDNFWYELINGELVKKSAPAPRHQMIQANLFRLLGNFVFNNSLGVLLCAPVDVFVDDFSIPQPDLLFIAKEQQHIITDDGVMGAPNLVVEILSPSSIKRDRKDKMNLYKRLRVQEYWIIDPNNQAVEVYHLIEDDYDLVSFAVERGNVDSTELVGFSLEVSAVF
jgi:Uma2 family endonuclease